MKKPKLLIARDNFLPRWDGIARVLTEIIPLLIKDYDVTVIAPNYGEYKPKGYKLIRIKKSKLGLGDYEAARFDRKTIKREIKKTDIVFTQTIGPIGFLSIYYARRKKKKIATYIHSVEWELVPMATNNLLLRKILYPVTKLMTKFIYKKPDLLIVPSSFLADELTWRGIDNKKTVATLGVDCEMFKPLKESTKEEKEKTETIRKELQLENNYVIGNHGRIANEKDLITLLRAYNRFKKKHKNAKLLIIGDGLESIKKKLRKTKGCILTGKKNNAQDYLKLMNAYVTTSLTETTSLTTLEAMATGLPVISTPVGFIKEYIKHGENGLIFKPKNSYDLYKKLEQIKNDPVRATKLKINARNTVTENFQWKNTAEKIKEALKNL